MSPAVRALLEDLMRLNDTEPVLGYITEDGSLRGGIFELQLRAKELLDADMTPDERKIVTSNMGEYLFLERQMCTCGPEGNGPCDFHDPHD